MRVWACGCADARAVRGRSIAFTKVLALPESLGQCKLFEGLCVPRPPPPPPPCACAAVPARRCGAWRCRAGRWGRAARRWMRRRFRSSAVGRAPRTHGWRTRPDRRAVRGGPGPPGAAGRWARRDATNTELAALPAAADWPNLKTL